MSKNRKNIICGIALVTVTSVITFFLTTVILFGKGFSKPKYQITFETDAVDINNIKRFNEVRKILKSDYFLDVDENVLLEGAISGMADSLGDPYTVYFTKEQMQAFREKSEGSYVGIGVSIIVDKDGLHSSGAF